MFSSPSVLIAILFCSLLTSAQTSPTPPGQPAPTPPQQPASEHKVTPEEAKELFKSVDEVLRFASKDTLLPMKHGVKRRMIGRDEVEKYVADKFKDDADRIRFERSELVLKKFGLLPRDFDLHRFLIKLLSEQVAGYYDEKTKTMNLLDWVESEMQRPVMAHELTHALQDQSYDLEKLSKHDEDLEKRGLEDPNSIIQTDEESTCRSAVLEGQAMIVLLDYILAPAGRSTEKTPSIVDMMEGSMENNKESPVFESAPLLLKEELTFPYGRGMKFIRDLLVAGGKEKAFKGVLDRLPQTTREVLEPKEYLAGRRVPPLRLPDFAGLKKDYEAYDVGAVGELDLNILLQVYADKATADRLSPEWRGGAYYAAGRKGAKQAGPNSTSHIGLYYASKWSTDAAAQEFVKLYAAALEKRYTGLQRSPASRPGLENYATSDGPVTISQNGNVVIAVESFDVPTAEKLISAGLKQAQDSDQQASTP